MKYALAMVQLTSILDTGAAEPTPGLSGGDATLGWSAQTLENGDVITITTDGTYDFGAAPTAVMQQGFGAGWMYTQPINTVLTTGLMIDGMLVSQGEARRIEEVDGIRAYASRLRDPDGWAGDKGAARHISWDTGDLMPGDKVAVFTQYKWVSPTPPLNWQLKLIRLQPVDTSTDNLGDVGLINWRNTTYTFVKRSTGQVTTYSSGVVAPHVGYGWQAHTWLQEMSTEGAVDGLAITRICAENDRLNVRERQQLTMTNDGVAPRPKYVLWQDYVDDSSGTTYEPADIDLYVTDMQAQKGSFGAVYIGDAPTPGQCKNMIPLPLVISPTIAWSNDEIKLRMWKHTRAWPVAYSHIYNGTTGLYQASVHIRGTYVPPAYDFYTDYEGFSRNVGSNTVQRTIAVANLTRTTGTKRRWNVRAKLRDMHGENGVFGYGTVQGLMFREDGSVYFRIGTMQAAEAEIRAPGPHTLTLGVTHVIGWEINAAGNQVVLDVDGVTIGSFTRTGMDMPIVKFCESGGGGSGWKGTFYGMQYFEDDVLVHQFELNGAIGAKTDSIGGVATATVGTGFVSVLDSADNSLPVVPDGALDLGNIPVTTGTTFSAATLLAGVVDADGDVVSVVGVFVTSGNATVSGSYKIAPTVAGAGAGYVIITDGRGGFANRDLVWVGV